MSADLSQRIDGLLTSQRIDKYVHLNPELAYARGWLVHPWDDPATVDVRSAS